MASRASSAVAALTLLAAAVLLCLSGSAEARNLLGPKHTYTPADFKQCGGSGNNCKGSKCKDARWPGVSCKSGLKCFRNSKYYWGCDVKQPAAPAPGAYKQCGGLNGGGCEKNDTCADAPWKGHTCPKNFSCYRANKWYWQCDTKPITNGGK